MIAAAADNQSQLDGGSGYAMLSMDGLKLLIPQKQIIALEMAKDMELTQTDDCVAGYLQFNNKSWPVFCLNKKLSLINSEDSLKHRFCVLLQTDNVHFGILSEQALLLNSGELTPQPLPEAMITVDSPLSALTVYEGKIICISSAEHLTHLLPENMLSKMKKTS